MASKPLILAFDTSAAHCAAALLCGDDLLGCHVENLARGQAERLMPMIEELLTEADTKWSDLSRIGVGIGPGNFTGIRISVAAARGLALSLGIPAVGVSSLQTQFDDSPILATVSAPRDQVYVQSFGADPFGPKLMPSEEARALAAELGLAMTSALPADHLVKQIASIAQYADSITPPAPLYVRAADAAPPRDPAPVILP